MTGYFLQTGNFDTKKQVFTLFVFRTSFDFWGKKKGRSYQIRLVLFTPNIYLSQILCVLVHTQTSFSVKRTPYCKLGTQHIIRLFGKPHISLEEIFEGIRSKRSSNDPFKTTLVLSHESCTFFPTTKHSSGNKYFPKLNNLFNGNTRCAVQLVYRPKSEKRPWSETKTSGWSHLVT
jgi:hypothetical protein